MKKLIALLCALLLVPCMALAEIDLSEMSFDDLVNLKDKINLAIWNSKEWQEVIVPQGLWKVGEDIPAGHYTFACAGKFAYIKIGDVLDETKKEIDRRKSKLYYSVVITNPDSSIYNVHDDVPTDEFVLENGMYVRIEDGDVVFTPYAGKRNLGFK